MVTPSGASALPRGEVLVYEDPDRRVRVEVRLERETVWLTQQQMAELFGRERSVITKHIRNVFAEGELARDAACANFAHTAGDGKTYQVEHYNLDVIISVGYRVKSLQGTRFRQWATKVLRDHLLRGYTLHERRLAERGLAEAEQALALLARTLTAHALVTDEGEAVLEVVQRYSRSWRWLLEYDDGRLSEQPRRAVTPTAALTLPEARAAVARRAMCSLPVAKPGRSSGRSAARGSRRFLPHSNRPSTGSRSTRACRRARRICSIS
jgi:hypothetical protein